LDIAISNDILVTAYLNVSSFETIEFSYIVVGLNLTTGQTMWNWPILLSITESKLLGRDDGHFVLNNQNRTYIISGISGNIIQIAMGYLVLGITTDSMYVAVMEKIDNSYYSNQIIRTDYSFSKNETVYDLGDYYNVLQVAIDGNVALYVTGRMNRLTDLLAAFYIPDGTLLWEETVPDPVEIDFLSLYVMISGDGDLFWTNVGEFNKRVKSCSTHGQCMTGTRKCQCDTKWTGLNCALCINTCSGNGVCNHTGDCVCNTHFVGENCSLCEENWGGDKCSVCVRPCSGKGTCDSAGMCICETSIWSVHLYSGHDCEVEALNLPLIIGSAVAAFVVLVLIISCIIRQARRKAQYNILPDH
jgi:hypothetical protein